MFTATDKPKLKVRLYEFIEAVRGISVKYFYFKRVEGMEPKIALSLLTVGARFSQSARNDVRGWLKKAKDNGVKVIDTVGYNFIQPDGSKGRPPRYFLDEGNAAKLGAVLDECSLEKAEQVISNLKQTILHKPAQEVAVKPPSASPQTQVAVRPEEPTRPMQMVDPNMMTIPASLFQKMQEDLIRLHVEVATLKRLAA